MLDPAILLVAALTLTAVAGVNWVQPLAFEGELPLPKDVYRPTKYPVPTVTDPVVY